jgi:preprotein translocase subunit Sss1
MPPRKVFETPEQAAEYLEELRRRNRERAKYFYDNKIKTDPEKYKQFLEKCKKPNNDFYHKNKNLTVEI